MTTMTMLYVALSAGASVGFFIAGLIANRYTQ